MKNVKSGFIFLLMVALIGLVGCGGGGGETGKASPLPRFTDNANGTVTDNLTDLVWLRRVDCFRFTSTSTDNLDTWSEAMAHSNSLASGSCELTDGSIAGEWRLPTIAELGSLLLNPPLPSVNPFSSSTSLVDRGRYWSSTTDSLNVNSAWSISMNFGTSISSNINETYFVWPVRNKK